VAVRERLMTMRTSTTTSSSSTDNTMTSTKNNPYVGWFRHAPPATATTSCSSSEFRWDGKNLYTPKSLDSMTEKTSPYVGWFRHAPPSRLSTRTMMTRDFNKSLEKFIQSHPMLLNNKPQRTFWIDGTLKGGAPPTTTTPSWNNGITDTSISRTLRQSLQESGEASPSATVQVLSRLATWILAPLDTEAVGARPNSLLLKSTSPLPPQAETDDEGEDDDDDDDHSDCSSSQDSIATVGTLLALDNQDRHIVHSPPLITPPQDGASLSLPPTMDVSVSSLAEAYYAHQAKDRGSSSSPSPSSSSTITTHADLVAEQNGGAMTNNHRLDFVITQMDIARMARNASRHLDVESILSLPTIVYRCEPDSSDDEGEDDFEDVGEGSWMIVPPPPKQEEQQREHVMTPEEAQEKETCVICLEHFSEGDTLRVLPCDHRFHVQCVDKWLLGSHSFEECYTSGCPTCKKDPIVESTPSLDGSVPSWAFARLGQALATSSTGGSSAQS